MSEFGTTARYYIKIKYALQESYATRVTSIIISNKLLIIDDFERRKMF
jgi:hypothetical protein